MTQGEAQSSPPTKGPKMSKLTKKEAKYIWSNCIIDPKTSDELCWENVREFNNIINKGIDRYFDDDEVTMTCTKAQAKKIWESCNPHALENTDGIRPIHVAEFSLQVERMIEREFDA